jgi:hypothetical protein
LREVPHALVATHDGVGDDVDEPALADEPMDGDVLHACCHRRDSPLDPPPG